MCEPFAMFPRRLLRAGLSHREQSVLLCLLSYKNNDGEAWPSRATIATDTGLHVSNVHKTVKSLAQKGMIAMDTQAGVRTVYTFPCLDGAAVPDIAENHTAQNLDMVDPAPVIAENATTESVPTQEIPAAPVRTVSEDVPKMGTIEKPATADNLSPVEHSGNSGMLPEPPASVPPEVNPAQLPAIVMAENAKPHNVTDAFMQELNARPIVQPKTDNADLMERARRLAALQAENSARSRAEKLAARGRMQDESEQDTAAPESALATATPSDNLPPVAKNGEQAAPVESIAQPAPDAAAPIILPVVVHESRDSAPQPALPIICAPQTATPQQGELLPAPVTAGQGELQPVKIKRCKSVAVQGELLPMETKKRATRLPEDWQLPRKWGEWAMRECGFTEDEVRYHAKRFYRHWVSSGGRNAYKVNWFLTYQNWMEKEQKDKERYNNRPQQKSKTRMAMERLISMSGGDFEIPF